MNLDKKTVALVMVAAAVVAAFWIMYSTKEEYPFVLSNVPSEGLVAEARTNPNLGEYQTYLTDPHGRTLYISLGECSGECLNNWIPYLANPNISTRTLGPDLRTKIGTMQLYNEADEPTHRQYTYLGHPLYYYKFDRNSGEINGHNIANGNWVAALLDIIRNEVE